MTVREMVAQQALSLSPEDRVYVLDRLEQSLFPEMNGVMADSLAGDDLAQELKRRSNAFQSGTTTACDAFDFMKQMRQESAR